MKKIFVGIIALSVLCLAMTGAAFADVKSGSTTQTRDIMLVEEGAANPFQVEVEEMHKKDFETTLTADKPDGVYNIGDSIVLNFKSDKDAYLTILDFTPSGQVIVLFPNEWVENNFVKAGEGVTVPVEGQGFSLKAGGPVGVDVVKAIATDREVQVFDIEKSELVGPFSVLKDTKVATRDILLMAEPGTTVVAGETAVSGDEPESEPETKWNVASLAVMTKEDGNDAPTGFATAEKGDWQAKAWANGNNFLVGERVFVKLLSNKAGRLVSLVNAGASSNENNLLPDGTDITFYAGELLVLPRDNDKWKLVAAKDAGRDSIKAKLALEDGSELELSFELTVNEDDEG